jgi:hypothetical protein
MSEDKRERWRELCEMAIVESNPSRVTELFREIDRLLSQASETEDQLHPEALQPSADAEDHPAPGALQRNIA